MASAAESRSAHLYVLRTCAACGARTAAPRGDMADYRLSAQVIKRSDGKSAVAAAAYRAAANLRDERTGTACDYSRKDGVTHSEILTPEATPDWMHDRAQLWNAVEAAERRRDAQLAREVQLSLPHELTDDQRRDLVRSFVSEQFVARGMVADLAIHEPNAAGDERNHHAHVMLTMRELAGDGFGKKARDWNSTEQLAHWREAWAHHQNRALERHGHAARVDHRSFEAQGIDREPSAHLGPVASDMERKGKASRIGNENRQAANNNAERARDHIAAARIASDRARFETWAAEKKAELANAQTLTALDLDQKHDRQKTDLETRIERDYGQAKATVQAEIATLDRRLEAKGVRKLLRTVFGQSRTDKQARQDMAKSLADIEGREREARQALEARQAAERDRLDEAQRNRRNAQRDGITKYRDRQERDGWRTAKKRGAEARPRPDTPSPAPQKPPEREEAPAPTRPTREPPNDNPRPPEPLPEAEPSERLDLDDKKRIADVHLESAENRREGQHIDKPWRRATRTDDAKPWRSNTNTGRTRSPFDRKPPR